MHSRYERRLLDLPLHGRAVQMRVTVRVSAAPNPAAGVAFSQSGSAMRSPADQLGGHRGLN
jgi:hypothetical protein